MDIVCPACGHTAHEAGFCANCKSPVGGPPSAPSLARPSLPSRCPITPAGVELTPAQQAVLARPSSCLEIKTGGQWHRVHWIASDALPAWEAGLRDRLARTQLDCLPPARLIEEANGSWVAVEAVGSPFQPWTSPVDDPTDECERLVESLDLIVTGLEELHAHGLVWLTFDPRCMELSAGLVRFTNLDLGVFPAGQCPERLPLRGCFAAPEIAHYHPEEIGARTDVFHLAMFAYYWLARMLPAGFAGDGLEAFGYQLPKLRTFAPRLATGIAPVLEKGLSLDPTERQATPRDLVAALQSALERYLARRSFQRSVRWEASASTRTGRTKSSLGKANEDCVLLLSFSNPERALLAVADGITTCDVGSGALASLIATIVLENTFDATSSRENFAERITAACRRGSETLLAWAMEKGYRTQLEEGADLMGTTLTAAWVEGSVLSLANLGDSRAYLIDATSVDQLTVDGDLASGMLADGMPPENVQDMGPITKALRECIGGCTRAPDGSLCIMAESCVPTLTQWPLLPGDVVVLCSDGLVEEDVFMEPETLGDIVRTQAHLSAAALADHLIDVADQLHRLPSRQEPEGFGDNISCVVIKIN